ncbi:hypothetical protein BJ170DRAFT_403527 [Xylariales sp. AK1849]|nr:hypothetical protein BJ170DRAFT_403527 [Xylariales sp. AK1849]
MVRCRNLSTLSLLGTSGLRRSKALAYFIRHRHTVGSHTLVQQSVSVALSISSSSRDGDQLLVRSRVRDLRHDIVAKSRVGCEGHFSPKIGIYLCTYSDSDRRTLCLPYLFTHSLPIRHGLSKSSSTCPSQSSVSVQGRWRLRKMPSSHVLSMAALVTATAVEMWPMNSNGYSSRPTLRHLLRGKTDLTHGYSGSEQNLGPRERGAVVYGGILIKGVVVTLFHSMKHAVEEHQKDQDRIWKHEDENRADR